MNLDRDYQARFDQVLQPLAINIQNQLSDYLKDVPRIDRVSARAKSIDRFLGKANATVDGAAKYAEPLAQIQDQVGARIVTFYLDDVNAVAEVVEKYYRPIEQQRIIPDNDWEFGYFGRHFVLFVPSEAIEEGWDQDMVPEFFELQIKTLFQHAWSEANHDLGYKPGEQPLEAGEARRLAFTSAQAWGADNIFSELFQERSTR